MSVISAFASPSVEVDACKEIRDFMSGFTLETTPGSAAKIADFREHVRAETPVYITFLPGSNFDDTVAVAKRLRNEGFVPIPHFAARSIPNKTFLENGLERLRDEANVSRVLLIGGAVPTPVGDFSDSMQSKRVYSTNLEFAALGWLDTQKEVPTCQMKPSEKPCNGKINFPTGPMRICIWSPSSVLKPPPSFNGINVFSQKATNCQSTSAFLAWRPSKHCWRTPKPAELAHQ